MGLSLDVTPLIEKLCDVVSKQRERDRQICKDALDCIRNEKSNLSVLLGSNRIERIRLNPSHERSIPFRKWPKP
jgi:hypothetical protein